MSDLLHKHKVSIDYYIEEVVKCKHEYVVELMFEWEKKTSNQWRISPYSTLLRLADIGKMDNNG